VIGLYFPSYSSYYDRKWDCSSFSYPAPVWLCITDYTQS
jgi:hypothetical protein